MLALYKGMEQKPKEFFVVHGELDAARAFAELLQTNLGVGTYIPSYGDTAIIDGTEWRLEHTKVLTDIPAVQELRDYMRSFEKDYMMYRARIEQIVIHDSSRIESIKAKLDKIRKFIDDVMKTI